MIQLTKAINILETEDELEAFLRDLLTPRERREFESRWLAAQLLARGELSYREIAAQTGMSVTTIGRVARFLRDEPNKGYQNALAKLGHPNHHGR